MKIQKIEIDNYKSLIEFELNNPNSFSVFAGSNGSGKSNIFEALEFLFQSKRLNSPYLENAFGGYDKIINYNSADKQFELTVYFENINHSVKKDKDNSKVENKYYSGVKNMNFADSSIQVSFYTLEEEANEFYNNSLHLFINKKEFVRVHDTSNKKLLPDASNLSAILKNVLANEDIREEFLDWMQLFIPGFENIEIHSDIDGASKFLIYEKGTQKPFDKNLISDGTYNILVLLTAVYQSQEPQFLCIEEPENGLNPYVIRSLVDFFRKQCEEKGHYIWLNTHSPVLVKELLPSELILVDKEEGITKIKQFSKDFDLHGLTMDEAWLSNALGGGIPW